MSQIDDDYDRRVQDRLILEKQRLEEDRKTRAGADSKFAKLVAHNAAELKKGDEQRRDKGDDRGRETIAQAKEFSQKVQAKQAVQAVKDPPENRRDGKPLQERTRGQLEDAKAVQGRAADQSDFEQAQMGRSADVHEGEGRLEERKESSDQQSVGQTGAQRGAIRAEADGGGKQQGGGGDHKGSGDHGASQAFRLNPALMAPPAVAQPRVSAISEKLRALAAEIAQKIVQNVRVGTNRAGEAEFQIDLKSTVLAGLQIKVSGRAGKISAEFTAKDPEVIALLKKNADDLKQALSARGLTLVDLKIEERK